MRRLDRQRIAFSRAEAAIPPIFLLEEAEMGMLLCRYSQLTTDTAKRCLASLPFVLNRDTLPLHNTGLSCLPEIWIGISKAISSRVFSGNISAPATKIPDSLMFWISPLCQSAVPGFL